MRGEMRGVCHKAGKGLLAGLVGLFGLTADAASAVDRSALSDAYWQIWNDAAQARIDADIEANRKADAVVAVDASEGTDVTVEQLTHEFRFGAHIFNFNQLGKKEYNDAYKSSYGKGGIFNQATVAFYWKQYEPTPGRFRADGDYEDTERFWNGLTRAEAKAHPFWRRPAPGPVLQFLKERDLTAHGHILIWNNAKPDWLYDQFCPEVEKRCFDDWGIVRHADCLAGGTGFDAKAGWIGSFDARFRESWWAVYDRGLAADDIKRRTPAYLSQIRRVQDEITAAAPVYVANLRRLFRKRIFDVAARFGETVDSWDVVNESSGDWQRLYEPGKRAKVWAAGSGPMPAEYPLDALRDAKEAFPSRTKLVINDYKINEAFLRQVDDLTREGARVDLVGCQMHLMDTNQCRRLAEGATDVSWVGTPASIREHLDLMAKTGRPLHLSEITITSPGADDRSLQIQAVLARNFYRACFAHPSMWGITWWNTVDGGGVKGEPLVSGLFTEDLQKKPAYLALDELINREWKTRLEVKVKGQERTVSFRGFRGRYRLSWKDGRGNVREKFFDLN